MLAKVNLSEQIEKYKTISFKNVREADGWYLECANSIYDTYEMVCSLDENVKNISEDDISEMRDYLEQLHLQAGQFLDLLEDKYFDCKNYDRLNHVLGTIEQEIPAILVKFRHPSLR